jgi:hypothetical protein
VPEAPLVYLGSSNVPENSNASAVAKALGLSLRDFFLQLADEVMIE